MKATIEFDVTGCHDCLLSVSDSYDYLHICSHPDVGIEDNGKFVNEKTFPEWCPLAKKEQPKLKIGNNGTISKDEFETACFEKVKPETAYWEKCGYIHKGEIFLIGATCSKCNNSKEFEGIKTENGYIDFDYTKIDTFCSVCGAKMSNTKTENSNEPVKKKRPCYAYNTDINGKEGKYKIVFETDDRSGYRQLEEYIRENFIDKKATQVHSSYGFSGIGKCLKCGNTYTFTSAKPLRHCMACGVEIKTNWS